MERLGFLPGGTRNNFGVHWLGIDLTYLVWILFVLIV